MIERKLQLKLTDIYGGDGFERPHTIEEVTLKESKKNIVVRKDIGVPVEREKERRKVTEKEIAVRTFKRNNNGDPMYRLGGTHGKLWGCMKESAESMYDTGEIGLSLTAIKDRFMPSIQVKPQWCVLHMEDCEIEHDILPQMLEGAGNKMVQHHFDVIPESTAKVTILHPEAYNDQVEKVINRLPVISFGNKRRGQINILNQDINEI